MTSTKMERAIIVTGTPGTGKTRLATKFADSIHAKHIDLSKFISKHGLYIGLDEERRTKIIDVPRTRRELTRLMSHSDETLVLDTHMPDRVLPKKRVRCVFVLRCHPRVLKSRLLARGWKTDKIYENLLAETLDSCLVVAIRYYGNAKVTELDTSHASIKKCVGSMRRHISFKHLRRKSTVDWMAELEKEGLLEEYLK